jgi:hypothetical protein
MDPAVTVRTGLSGLLAPAATVAVVAIGLRVSGLAAAEAVGFALAIAWAAAGLAVARTADRAVAWQIELGALTGAVALTAARLGGPHGQAVATIAASLVIAISFHFLLALPDGRLARPGRRIVVGLGYASAAGTGIGLAIAGQPLPLMAGALIWSLAVLCALPATRLRYLKAAGHDKERMQWLGTGLALAASIALIGAVPRPRRCRWP